MKKIIPIVLFAVLVATTAFASTDASMSRGGVTIYQLTDHLQAAPEDDALFEAAEKTYFTINTEEGFEYNTLLCLQVKNDRMFVLALLSEEELKTLSASGESLSFEFWRSLYELPKISRFYSYNGEAVVIAPVAYEGTVKHPDGEWKVSAHTIP